MKNFCYAFGLASCAAAQIYGPKSALAGRFFDHDIEATYLSIDIWSINFTEGLKQLGSNLSMYRSVEVKSKLEI